MATPLYRRILLKLSGESLMGSQSYGIDPAMLRQFARDIADVHSLGVQIGIVIGGGNIFRGSQAAAAGIDKVSADYMGMLATVINALGLQNALEALGLQTRLQTAIHMAQIAEPFIRRRAIRHLEKGRCDLRRGHRQPVLHHRHCGCLTRNRNRSRVHHQRHPR